MSQALKRDGDEKESAGVESGEEGRNLSSLSTLLVKVQFLFEEWR